VQYGQLLAEAEPKLAALAAARQNSAGWPSGQTAPVQPVVGVDKSQIGNEQLNERLRVEIERMMVDLAAVGQKLEQTAPLQPVVGVYQYQIGDEFRDCEDCPLMVVVPAGSFTMGSPKAWWRLIDQGPPAAKCHSTMSRSSRLSPSASTR